jgi:DNA-binding beta-propeller fold protein YncE
MVFRGVRWEARRMLRISGLALLLTLAIPAPASAAPGALSQPSGTAACISDDGSGGQCADGAGLASPRGIAISPDGRNVYVGGYSQSSIAIFSRDPSTGTLTETGCLSEGGKAPGCTSADQGANLPERVTMSPDGKTLYVSSMTASSVSAFPRDPATGALGKATCLTSQLVQGCDNASARALRNTFDVTVSPDGANVYSTSIPDQAVAEFTRDAATGKLTQSPTKTGCISHDGTSPWLGHLPDNCATIAAGNGSFSSPQGIAAAPDGKSVLAVARNSGLQNFLRDGSGVLTDAGCIGFVQGCPGGHGMGKPWDLAVAPDGKAVLVATTDPGGLAVFHRNGSTGAIAQAMLGNKNGCFVQDGSDGCIQGRSVADARGVAVSPDGRDVYLAAAGSGAIASFSRDPDTNHVRQLDGSDGCVSYDGSGGLCGPGKLLQSVQDVVTSPDGRNVYAVSESNAAVLTFDREQPQAAGGGSADQGNASQAGESQTASSEGGGLTASGQSAAETPHLAATAPATTTPPAKAKKTCRKVKAKKAKKHHKRRKAKCATKSKRKQHRRTHR